MPNLLQQITQLVSLCDMHLWQTIAPKLYCARPQSSCLQSSTSLLQVSWRMLMILQSGMTSLRQQFLPISPLAMPRYTGRLCPGQSTKHGKPPSLICFGLYARNKRCVCFGSCGMITHLLERIPNGSVLGQTGTWSFLHWTLLMQDITMAKPSSSCRITWKGTLRVCMREMYKYSQRQCICASSVREISSFLDLEPMLTLHLLSSRPHTIAPGPLPPPPRYRPFQQPMPLATCCPQACQRHAQ